MAKDALGEILEQLCATQRELDREIDRLLTEGREQFRYTLERGRVVFERGMQNLHRQRRKGLLRYLRDTPITFILSAPLIYGMLVPYVILDLSVTVFQHICFRIYGIPRVRRGDFLVIDRPAQIGLPQRHRATELHLLRLQQSVDGVRTRGGRPH